MSKSSRLPGIAALLFATGSWGGLFLVSKPALAQVDAFWFTVVRYSLSASLLLVLIAPRGLAPWRKLRTHFPALAFRGTAGFGVFSVLLLVGLAHSSPSHGAVVMATAPLSTQLMRWLLDGVRPARATLLTAALALAGVAVVSGAITGGQGVHQASLLGDLTMLLSSIGWIVYTRGATRFPGLDVVEYTALTVVASWPVLLSGAIVATLLGAASWPGLDRVWSVAPELAYVGFVSSAIAVLAFNFGVRSQGAVTATAFFNFVPVSALSIGVVLGHVPTWNELVGTGMVIAALLLHTLGSAATARGVTAVPGGRSPARA
jgi:drug/metabolite transporter (DMT)-like permease